MERDADSDGGTLRLASFFSGIGGFELGFERAGFETVFQCEIDPFCSRVLQKHWPEVPRSEDIREVRNGDVPFAEVWAAGFPCQDVSVARMGTRAGLRGKRSGLFYEFARVVEEGCPCFVVLENVPGLLSSHRGRDFAIVVRTLAELGYSVGWRVLDSKNFGVAQSRQRVFIVGCHRDRRGAAEVLFEPECSQGDVEFFRCPADYIQKTQRRLDHYDIGALVDIFGDFPHCLI